MSLGGVVTKNRVFVRFCHIDTIVLESFGGRQKRTPTHFLAHTQQMGLWHAAAYRRPRRRIPEKDCFVTQCQGVGGVVDLVLAPPVGRENPDRRRRRTANTTEKSPGRSPRCAPPSARKRATCPRAIVIAIALSTSSQKHLQRQCM